MTRSQLLFVILLNALVSFAVALAVVWIVDSRRPDPEELAALAAQSPNLAVIAPTQPSAPQGEQPAQVAGQTPEQPVAPTDTPPPPGQTIEHVVQSGDSLAVIANKYKTTQDAIIKANNIADPNLLYVGVKLIIPVGGDVSVPANAPTVQAQTGEGMRINAINGVGDLANEVLELVNDSDQAYALQGWRIQKEGGPEYTFADVQIFAGSNVRLFSAAGTDNTVKRYWNQPAAVWQSGTVAKLLNSQGNVVTTFTVP